MNEFRFVWETLETRKKIGHGLNSDFIPRNSGKNFEFPLYVKIFFDVWNRGHEKLSWPWITCVGGCTWLTPWTRDHSSGQTKASTGSKMLYKKANWLLTSAVGQTGQWSAMPVEISRWHFNFCQTAQIIICARDSKNERRRNFKNSNWTVSKAKFLH